VFRAHHYVRFNKRALRPPRAWRAGSDDAADGSSYSGIRA
jgi:hypothetical protein